MSFGLGPGYVQFAHGVVVVVQVPELVLHTVGPGYKVPQGALPPTPMIPEAQQEEPFLISA